MSDFVIDNSILVTHLDNGETIVTYQNIEYICRSINETKERIKCILVQERIEK